MLERLWGFTCDLVSTELSMAPVSVFQVLMQRSALPPPLASRLDWKGHHASACRAQKKTRQRRRLRTRRPMRMRSTTSGKQMVQGGQQCAVHEEQ